MYNFYRQHKMVTFKVTLQISPGSFLQGENVSAPPEERDCSGRHTPAQRTGGHISSTSALVSQLPAPYTPGGALSLPKASTGRKH